MSALRTVEDCHYRTHVRRDAEHGEVACCRLLGEITEIEDDSLFDASRGACEACITKHAPSPSDINSVIASLLYGVANKVTSRSGVSGCDADEAARLRQFAKDNLEVIMTPQGGSAPNNANAASCFYRGDQIGERDCPGCRGTVRTKLFACHHTHHDETTISECRTCRDYEPGLVRGSVRHWAVGVTAAPRQEPTIDKSLRSLQAAGWESPRLFAEPGTALPTCLAPSLITVRQQRLGAWPNWLLALTELVLTDPQADAYLMCQDDVLYCRGLREYLEETLWPARNLGVVSLHTASHQDRGDVDGYYSATPGWGAWGAQAYVFSNSSARALLSNQRVIDHRSKGPGDGLRNVDSVVGQWCLESGLAYYLHTPSPTQHVGKTSTLWGNSDVTGRRRSATYVGEDVDIRERLADRGNDRTVPAAPPQPSQ